MNMAVPAYRIIQTFLLGETQYCLDLWADLPLADASIKKSHENDGGNLLHKSPVFGLKIRQGRRRGRCPLPPVNRLDIELTEVGFKWNGHARKPLKNGFHLRRADITALLKRMLFSSIPHSVLKDSYLYPFSPLRRQSGSLLSDSRVNLRSARIVLP